MAGTYGHVGVYQERGRYNNTEDISLLAINGGVRLVQFIHTGSMNDPMEKRLQEVRVIVITITITTTTTTTTTGKSRFNKLLRQTFPCTSSLLSFSFSLSLSLSLSLFLSVSLSSLLRFAYYLWSYYCLFQFISVFVPSDWWRLLFAVAVAVTTYCMYCTVLY